MNTEVAAVRAPKRNAEIAESNWRSGASADIDSHSAALAYRNATPDAIPSRIKTWLRSPYFYAGPGWARPFFLPSNEGMERRKALGRSRGALWLALRSANRTPCEGMRTSCDRCARLPALHPDKLAQSGLIYAAFFGFGPRLPPREIKSRQAERAPRARAVVPVGRGPEPPGSWLTRPARRQPHPVPPARRLMMTPSNGQNAANINARECAGISSPRNRRSISCEHVARMERSGMRDEARKSSTGFRFIRATLADQARVEVLPRADPRLLIIR